MAFLPRIQRIARNGEDASNITPMPAMVGPYQPSLLRVLHGAAALLVGLAWVTGLVLLGGLDGRFGRLPFAADGDWIELHGHLGVVLALVLLLFGAYATTLGASRLRRIGNLLPLLALVLAVGSGLLMEEDWLVDQRQIAPIYGVHLTAWLLLALTVPAHLVATLRRGGWPLTMSIWSLRLHPNDGPAHWPAQVLRFIKRGPKI